MKAPIFQAHRLAELIHEGAHLPSSPPWPNALGVGPPPPAAGTWQCAQLIESPLDRRISKTSWCPKAILSFDWGLSFGIGTGGSFHSDKSSAKPWLVKNITTAKNGINALNNSFINNLLLPIPSPTIGEGNILSILPRFHSCRLFCSL